MILRHRQSHPATNLPCSILLPLSKAVEKYLPLEFRCEDGWKPQLLPSHFPANRKLAAVRGIELRGLRMENVYLRPAGEISETYILPEACKNNYRPRKIALNEVAKWAVNKMYQRAIKLG